MKKLLIALFVFAPVATFAQTPAKRVDITQATAGVRTAINNHAAILDSLKLRCDSLEGLIPDSIDVSMFATWDSIANYVGLVTDSFFKIENIERLNFDLNVLKVWSSYKSDSANSATIDYFQDIADNLQGQIDYTNTDALPNYTYSKSETDSLISNVTGHTDSLLTCIISIEQHSTNNPIYKIIYNQDNFFPVDSFVRVGVGTYFLYSSILTDESLYRDSVTFLISPNNMNNADVGADNIFRLYPANDKRIQIDCLKFNNSVTVDTGTGVGTVVGWEFSDGLLMDNKIIILKKL